MYFSIFMVIAAVVINSTVAVETFKLEYYLSATGLTKTDELTQPDALCVVFIRVGDGNNWNEDKMTNYEPNTANPVWKERFNVVYRSGENTYLKIDVYDKDYIEQDFLGFQEFSVLDMVRANNFQVTTTSNFAFTSKKLTGRYIDKGTLKIQHRITEISGYRSASSRRQHLALFSNALLAALSLNYFLRI